MREWGLHCSKLRAGAGGFCRGSLLVAERLVSLRVESGAGNQWAHVMAEKAGLESRVARLSFHCEELVAGSQVVPSWYLRPS